MTLATMRDALIVALVTVLWSLVQARSVSKELLELNNHINTQFGFDYSNDEDFFSLIGVEVKPGDSDSESYGYEYYDFNSDDNNGKLSENAYDEDDRNDSANEAVEEFERKKYILPNDKSERENVGKLINQNEDSDEYDENRFDDNHDSKENDSNDVNQVLIKSEKGVINNNDDSFVNDYDESRELFHDEDDGGAEEEEEGDYDEDYDYEGEDSEEYDEQYYDSKDGEDNSEEYFEQNDDKKDDYYDDYDYSEEEDNNTHDTDGGGDDNARGRKNFEGKNEATNKNKEQKEAKKSDHTYYDYSVDGDAFRGENKIQSLSDSVVEKHDYEYQNYDDFNY